MSYDSHPPVRGSNVGIPLDEYLAGTDDKLHSNSLSDDEFERRIGGQPSHPEAIPEGKKPIAEAFAQFMNPVDDDAHAQTVVDTAVKAAAHGVKVLAPLLSKIVEWVPQDQPEQIPVILGAALERIRSDAMTVSRAFGVEPEDAPAWLTSQISGMIMPILVNALGRNNGALLKEGDTGYLQAIIQMAEKAKHAGLLSPMQPISTDWELIQALTVATTDVMTEYHAFSYFHEDPAYVAQTISDYLQDRVLYGTLGDLTARWGLNDRERAYMGVSLLSQAGKMMANCWAQQIACAMSYVHDQPKAVARSIMATGYPLEHIFDAFERIYRGLEVSSESALKSMAPMRERFPDQDSKNAPGLR